MAEPHRLGTFNTFGSEKAGHLEFENFRCQQGKDTLIEDVLVQLINKIQLC